MDEKEEKKEITLTVRKATTYLIDEEGNEAEQIDVTTDIEGDQ